MNKISSNVDMHEYEIMVLGLDEDKGTKEVIGKKITRSSTRNMKGKDEE